MIRSLRRGDRAPRLSVDTREQTARVPITVAVHGECVNTLSVDGFQFESSERSACRRSKLPRSKPLVFRNVPATMVPPLGCSTMALTWVPDEVSASVTAALTAPAADSGLHRCCCSISWRSRCAPDRRTAKYCRRHKHYRYRRARALERNRHRPEPRPQFTREYGRMFGLPPARDAEAVRSWAEAAA